MTQESLRVHLSEIAKAKLQKPRSPTNIETTAEANNNLKLVAALDDAPLPINDLPKELLVSIFIAVGDPIWVTHRPLSPQGLG